MPKTAKKRHRRHQAPTQKSPPNQTPRRRRSTARKVSHIHISVKYVSYCHDMYDTVSVGKASKRPRSAGGEASSLVRKLQSIKKARTGEPDAEEGEEVGLIDVLGPSGASGEEGEDEGGGVRRASSKSSSASSSRKQRRSGKPPAISPLSMSSASALAHKAVQSGSDERRKIRKGLQLASARAELAEKREKRNQVSLEAQEVVHHQALQEAAAKPLAGKEAKNERIRQHHLVGVLPFRWEQLRQPFPAMTARPLQEYIVGLVSDLRKDNRYAVTWVGHAAVAMLKPGIIKTKENLDNVDNWNFDISKEDVLRIMEADKYLSKPCPVGQEMYEDEYLRLYGFMIGGQHELVGTNHFMDTNPQLAPGLRDTGKLTHAYVKLTNEMALMIGNDCNEVLRIVSSISVL